MESYIKENYIKDKVIIITGAATGFGKLVAERTAAMGGKIVCCDRKEEELKKTVEGIRDLGGEIEYRIADMTKKDEVDAVAKLAVEKYGRIDILLNNAGTMPLSFFSDHERAWKAWDDCIDTNIKGVVYGISAVYDQMIKQEKGHIINISTINSNHPVIGGCVYQASKVAVKYISDTLRQEAYGKIKVTCVKPTGVPTTPLFDCIINQDTAIGLVGQNALAMMGLLQEMPGRPDLTEQDSIRNVYIDPSVLADNVVYVMNQPWGINISDITVRSAGEPYIM